MKYKVGQKVRVRKDLCRALENNGWIVADAMMKYRGMTVTIAMIDFNHYHIKEDGAIWTWTDEMFEPACAEKIVITSDGVTTTARKYDGKKLIKEAKAACSKDDVFNFEVGANLAMERLLEEKPKFYNGKVVCLYNTALESFYTKGKIYQFRDGVAYNDAGCRFHCCANHPITSFDELRGKSFATWLEVVE